MMKIPNADILERTGSEMLGARFWRQLVSSSKMGPTGFTLRDRSIHPVPKVENWCAELEISDKLREAIDRAMS